MSGKKSARGITAFGRKEYDDHQKFLSSRMEWPGLNVRDGEGKICSTEIIQIHVTVSILISDSRVTFNGSMLIMELYRLVPFKDGRYVNFHPFNMPHVKVRKIELVGTVMKVKRNVNNLVLKSKARGKV